MPVEELEPSPPKDGSVSPHVLKHFPPPPGFKLTDDQGFKYWNSLPKYAIDRSAVYVYRGWPVLAWENILTEKEKELVRQGKMIVTRNIDKPPEPFGLKDWKMEVLQRYGSGTYHFKINDVGIKGNNTFAKKNICMWDVRNLEHPDYPPVIPKGDYRLVDVSHPENASYVAKLRLAGIKLFGDEPSGFQSEEEGEEMAVQTAIMEKVMDQNERLVKQVTDAKAKEEKPAPPADPNAAAGLKAVELVADAAKRAGDILAQAEASKSKAADPLEYYDRVEAGIAKGIENRIKSLPPAAAPAAAPAAGADTQLQMFDRLLSMQEKSTTLLLAQMEARIAAQDNMFKLLIEDLRAARTQQVAPPPPPPPPAQTAETGFGRMLHELSQIGKVRESIAEMFNLQDNGAADDVPGWVPYAFKGLGMAITGVANIVHNAAVIKTGQGMAQPLGQLDTDVPGQEGGEPVDQAPASDQEVAMQFMNSIQTPLHNALMRQIPGHEFAAAVIASHGRDAYEFLVSMGENGVLQMLKTHQGIWGLVMTNPQHFQVFLSQFLNVGAVNAYLANPRPSAPPPPPAPKPQVLKPERQEQPRATHRPGTPIQTVDGRVIVDPGTGQPVKTQAQPGEQPPAAATHRPPVVNRPAAAPSPADV